MTNGFLSKDFTRIHWRNFCDYSLMILSLFFFFFILFVGTSLLILKMGVHCGYFPWPPGIIFSRSAVGIQVFSRFWWHHLQTRNSSPFPVPCAWSNYLFGHRYLHVPPAHYRNSALQHSTATQHRNSTLKLSTTTQHILNWTCDLLNSSTKSVAS